MATVVFFHAHPDDETTSTGGTMARAAAEGHRVVLVVATDGRWGETPDDLAPGETLVERRRGELEASARLLGASRVEWLGYADSGMTGWEQNALPGAFVQADVEEAAARLAQILREEEAAVLTSYDWHGNYGHPDHIAVHRVGARAAELAGTPVLYEATMNRDHMRRLLQAAREMGTPVVGGPDGEEGSEFDPDGPADDGNPMGEPETAITIEVDVTAYTARKREAMACHRSQTTDIGFFLAMPEEVFDLSFGKEWFIRPGVGGPMREGWLFEA